MFRTIAVLAALCVLVLAVFAASPELHTRLHVGATSQTVPVGEVDHVCAVTLFATGVTALLIFCLLTLGRLLPAGLVWRPVDEIAAAQPRYRLVPSHAPPAA